MTIAYGACLLVSAAVFVYMVQKNYSNIDVNYWTIVVLVPIITMGYWLKTQAVSPEAATTLFCFIYLDSTLLITTALFSMMHALGFQVGSWVKMAVYSIACAHVALICLCVHNDLYYQSMSIIVTPLGNATKMVSGPLKIIHYVFLAGIVLWFLGIMLASFIRRGTYSRKTFALYSAIVGAGVVAHLAESLLNADFTTLPFIYAIGDVAIAMKYDYVHMHDIVYVLSNQQKHYGARGYVAIGLYRQFQSCNDKAFEFLPFLDKQRVDEKISSSTETGKMILDLVDACERDGQSSAHYQIGEMICACEVHPYSIRRAGEPQGFLIDVRDATEEQRNYNIITAYNETLNAEVVEKTNSIRDMQRKIVVGMANMIENRDNNTGGHVKRTSDIIRILVDEIMRQGGMGVTDEMARDIVRAAPTHDLGKITIDSSILNKPGKLTDEEYEIMKTHAAKSGELVLILLDGVEEERFVHIAFNVARYHHERWDGRGYPEGLVGTMIPLEARIMAVADVYDALVSKRAYKEPMDFGQAYSIMIENMGAQFDPNMKSVFVGCRSRLERYYRQHM